MKKAFSLALIASLMASTTFAAEASLNCVASKEGESAVKQLVQTPDRDYPYVFTTIGSYDVEAILAGSTLAVLYRKQNAGDVLSKTIVTQFKMGSGQKVYVSSPSLDATIVCQ